MKRKHVKLFFKAKKNGILYEQVKYKWRQEVMRVLEWRRKECGSVEEMMEGTLVDEGYAELEGNDTLYVYGNAYARILSDVNLQNSIGRVNIFISAF